MQLDEASTTEVAFFITYRDETGVPKLFVNYAVDLQTAEEIRRVLVLKYRTVTIHRG